MNVIVFAVRGCPAGWLGGYGNEWVGTPHLDRLAAEGVVLDRHISDCPDPDAARRAWLTGQGQGPPYRRGDGETRDREKETPTAPLSPGLPVSRSPHRILLRACRPENDPPAFFADTFLEVIDARPTADDPAPLAELVGAFPDVLDRLAAVPHWLLWVEIDALVPPWGVNQEVFEAYLAGDQDDEEEGGERDPGEDAQPDEDAGPDDDEAERDADESTPDETAEAADADPDPEGDDDGPVTPWYDPPTGPFDRSDFAAWEWLRRTFAAVVTVTDAHLGAAFDMLRDRGLDMSAAWVVTSDFGLPLGEHGQVGVHRPWLHEELVHLPLILRLPGGEQAGRRVSAFTQPPDLCPTLRELLGEPPTPADGFSLLPLARGEGGVVRGSARSGLVVDGEGGWALRTSEWALLVSSDPGREPQLFAKPDDYWEVADLRPRELERAEALEAELRRGREPEA